MIKIDEIRARHEAGERASAVEDREWLLSKVERLRAENARLRAQVAEYFDEPPTHPVERDE